MRFGSFAAAALLVAGIAVAAHAQQAQPQQAPAQQAAVEPLPMRTILDQVEAQGYRDIREIERDKNHYEVKATDAEGRRVELELDAQTGKILKTERK